MMGKGRETRRERYDKDEDGNKTRKQRIEKYGEGEMRRMGN